jgi:hypothetical protein
VSRKLGQRPEGNLEDNGPREPYLSVQEVARVHAVEQGFHLGAITNKVVVAKIKHLYNRKRNREAVNSNPKVKEKSHRDKLSETKIKRENKKNL